MDSTTWFNAVKSGDFTTIKSMHQQGFDINAIDDIKDTALMWAASSKEEESGVFIAEYLLYNNANVDIQDKEGLTALMYAIMASNIKIAKLLINKSNLNLKDSRGRTALMWACSRKLLNPVKEILKRKSIDINEVDNSNGTALHYACLANEFTGDYPIDIAIVKLLIAKKIDINIANQLGQSALYLAVKSDKKDVVQFLLLCGAIMNGNEMEVVGNKTMKDLLTSWQSSEGEI